MFLTFFTELRAAKVPVSLREFLTLMGALDRDLADKRVDEFYYLARATLVKDERNLDKFDRVFGQVFKGIETLAGALEKAEIPEEWLRKIAEKYLTEEEKRQIEAMGWDKLLETLKERLKEQKGRHQGGSKWIGTGGTSPYGAYGYNPEGIRIGQEGNRNFRAVKVWDKREFKDYDDEVELGVRNMRIALRRLRRFARTGAAEELDLDGTIRETANKGYLDVKLRPERRNAVKVLLFLDVGGSMDWHIEKAEELFSAARLEFKHFEHFYFHNCPYERVWKNNRRRQSEVISTLDVIRTYPSDYRAVFVGDASMSPYEIVMPGGSVEHWNEEAGQVWMERVWKNNRRRQSEVISTLDVIRTYPSDYRAVFVGDASMSPYEIVMPGGSVEHWNEEAGQVWMQRLLGHFHKAVWLSPVPQNHWGYTQSIGLMRQLMGNRMFPLTLEGLDGAMRELVR